MVFVGFKFGLFTKIPLYSMAVSMKRPGAMRVNYNHLVNAVVLVPSFYSNLNISIFNH